MTSYRGIFVATGCACLLAVTACLCMLILTVRSTVAAVPVEIQATRQQLVDQVEALRVGALGEIDRQATGIRKDTVEQVAALRTDAMSRIDTGLAVADRRVGDTLARVDRAINVSDVALHNVVVNSTAIVEQLKPLTQETQVLLKDAQDSWDELYPDIWASVGSGTVAITGIARAAEAVGIAAPQIQVDVTRMADDATREADQLTKPQTTRQKVMTWLELLPRIGLRLF